MHIVVESEPMQRVVEIEPLWRVVESEPRQLDYPNGFMSIKITVVRSPFVESQNFIIFLNQ